MSNYVRADGQTIIANDSYVIVNGKMYPMPPGKGCHITVINKQVYINGYKFNKGRWVFSLRGLWHLWF